MTNVGTLYVVVQDSRGRISYHPIGRALVEAELDARLTKLALRKHVAPLASFTVHSPTEAAEAIKTLDELGDVYFDTKDFDPQWFNPAECIPTIEALLEHRGNSVGADVRPELFSIQQVLSEASRQRRSFYLVELLPEEEAPIRPVILEKKV